MRAHSLPHLATAALLSSAAGAVQAHTGHGTEGLLTGLLHPFGPDHLLAMVAVGIWSVAALPFRKAWWGPATFMAAVGIGAMLGVAGFTAPYLEHAISVSVVLFGTMLVIAVRPMLPTVMGLILIAAAALLHGLAHGAEAPDAGFAGYVAGFLVTTVALHACGVGIGLAIQRWLNQHQEAALGGVGAALSVAGIYLMSQLPL